GGVGVADVRRRGVSPWSGRPFRAWCADRARRRGDSRRPTAGSAPGDRAAPDTRGGALRPPSAPHRTATAAMSTAGGHFHGVCARLGSPYAADRLARAD
ncbi:hypothetical protein DIS09_28010, partial [Burkholderia pseudomallei]